MPEPGVIRSSADDNFTQVPNWVIEDTNLSYGARFLYILLSTHVSYADVEADAPSVTVYPSMTKLAERMGYTKPTKKFYALRQELADWGLLSWVGRTHPDGRQASHLYTLSRRRPVAPTPKQGYPLPPNEGGDPPQTRVGTTPKRGYEVEPLNIEPMKVEPIKEKTFESSVVDVVPVLSESVPPASKKGAGEEGVGMSPGRKRHQANADRLKALGGHALTEWSGIPDPVRSWVPPELWELADDRGLNDYQLMKLAIVAESRASSPVPYLRRMIQAELPAPADGMRV